MERGDGFQGPIIVSDPENEEEKALEEMYDGEEVVFLQDWYHLDGQNRRTGEFIVSLIIVFSAYNQLTSQYLNHSFLLSQVLTAFLSSGLVMPKPFSSMVVESTLLASRMPPRKVYLVPRTAPSRIILNTSMSMPERRIVYALLEELN